MRSHQPPVPALLMVVVRTARRLASVLLLVLLVLATAAFGYEDTGFDPDDTQNCAVTTPPEACRKTSIPNPDIRSTTRKVRQNADGRRFLSITIRSFEPVMAGDTWVGKARMDAHAGRRVDHVMMFLNTPAGPPRCGIVSGDRLRLGAFRLTRWAATCVVPLRFVRPTKRIRWQAWTEYFFPEPYPTWDVAPNGGWFV